MSIELFGPEPEGATPLTDEDYLGLKPKWIATRGDLNLAEAQNILAAMDKHFRAPMKLEVILDDHFVRKLHKDMYSQVWTWAGTYRQIETSIGFDPLTVPESVFLLMENSKVWIQQAKSKNLDEIVCEIHHKLVQIHPFRNGNGRMTRLLADLLLISQNRPVFSWGGGGLEKVSLERTKYIEALQRADAGDISFLVNFVRSQ